MHKPVRAFPRPVSSRIPPVGLNHRAKEVPRHQFRHQRSAGTRYRVCESLQGMVRYFSGRPLRAAAPSGIRGPERSCANGDRCAVRPLRFSCCWWRSAWDARTRTSAAHRRSRRYRRRQSGGCRPRRRRRAVRDRARPGSRRRRRPLSHRPLHRAPVGGRLPCPLLRRRLPPPCLPPRRLPPRPLLCRRPPPDHRRAAAHSGCSPRCPGRSGSASC